MLSNTSTNVKLFLTFTLYLITFNSFAQSEFNTLGESMVSINHKVTENYSYNFIFRSRYFLNKNNTFLYKQQQVDVFHFSNFKLKTNNKIGIGAYYRNRDWFESGSNELRFIEDYTILKQKTSTRLTHRIRTEQRLLDTKTLFRQRYRFAINHLLNGNTLEVGNAYLTNSIEGLLSIGKTIKPETDIRISSQIGWLINENLKLQTGLEHRLEAFNLKAKNNLFVLTSAVFRI